MAKIYRPFYRDAAGRRVRSDVWWASYRGPDGKRVRESLGVRDKRSAEHLAEERAVRSDRRKAGLVTPVDDAADRSLEDHVADFESVLVSREVVERYRVDRLFCLRLYAKATGASALRDLDGVRASAWLSEERATGLSARSINRRRDALCQFSRWLLRERRIGFDPFATLGRLNEDVDRRRPRRALSIEELVRLLDVARTRPLADATRPRKIRGVEGVVPRLAPAERARLEVLGEERALAYEFAARTGLRRGELGKLRWVDVDLARGTLSVPARHAKSRKNQWVDLRADLVEVLRARRGDAPATDPVFPAVPALKVLQRDLVAAGLARVDELGKIDTRDEDGQTLDFASLRKTLGSHLAAAGVSPTVAKTVMRHSKIDLTLKHYTDLRLLDTKGAVERLPGIPRADREGDKDGGTSERTSKLL